MRGAYNMYYPSRDCGIMLITLASLALVVGAAETEECRSLGFTGLQLCSDCEIMASYVKDEGLKADCLSCCARGKEGRNTKFSAAVLEVNLKQIGAFPHIDGFVKNKAERFHPGLRLRDYYGAVFPRLILTPEGGGPKQTIQIEGWKTEHVEEFLDDKLTQPKPKATRFETASM